MCVMFTIVPYWGAKNRREPGIERNRKHYSALSDAMSMEKRYFTSDLSIRS